MLDDAVSQIVSSISHQVMQNSDTDIIPWPSTIFRSILFFSISRFVTTAFSQQRSCSWLLVNPVVLSELPGLQLLRLEPEGNFLLRALNTVGAVADVTTDILYELVSESRSRVMIGELWIIQWRSHREWYLERRLEGWSHQGCRGRSYMRCGLPRPWRRQGRCPCLCSCAKSVN